MNKDVIQKIKERVLEEEKASLSNINPTDDAQMIAKIMKIYDEEQTNDN